MKLLKHQVRLSEWNKTQVRSRSFAIGVSLFIVIFISLLWLDLSVGDNTSLFSSVVQDHSGTTPELPILSMPVKRIAPTDLNLPLEVVPPGEWTYEPAFPQLEIHSPMVLKMPEDGKHRFYVLERTGKLLSFDNDPEVKESTLVLDLTSEFKTGRNVGPYGLAFHPEFGKDGSPHRGYFYLFYKNTNSEQILARYHIPNGKEQADRESELVLIRQPSTGFHDAGEIEFGPDGFLYVAIGDDQDNHNRQVVNRNLFSGLFRIDVDQRGGSISHPPVMRPQKTETAHYYIPNDNPFIGIEGALEEFYALGLRNPYHFSFDKQTGEIWLGDVGAETWEQVYVVESGDNFTWGIKNRKLQKFFKSSNAIGRLAGPTPQVSPLRV